MWYLRILHRQQSSGHRSQVVEVPLGTNAPPLTRRRAIETLDRLGITTQIRPTDGTAQVKVMTRWKFQLLGRSIEESVRSWEFKLSSNGRYSRDDSAHWWA